MNDSDLFLSLFIAVMIIGSFLFKSVRERKILSNKLEKFARHHGLALQTSRRGVIVVGTYEGRSITIESFSKDKEGWHFYLGKSRANKKQTIMRIKMSVSHMSNAYLKFQALSYFTLPFIFKRDGTYIKMQDNQDNMNLIRILNVENDEVPPSALFDVQSNPKRLVKDLLEQHPAVKSKLVECFYSGNRNSIKSVEIKSGHIIVEREFSLIKKGSLEAIFKRLNDLAKDIERT